MVSRAISGLRTVMPAKNPWPAARQRGARALGLRFERKMAQALPQATHNPWFIFEDNNGPGYCSPDLIFEAAGVLWCAECKLTDWAEADFQLARLYLPVLRHIWRGPVRSLVVVKFLTPLTPAPRRVATLDEALSGADASEPPILWAYSQKELTPQLHKITTPRFDFACA